MGSYESVLPEAQRTRLGSAVLRHNAAQLPVTLAINQAQLHRVVLE